MLAFTQQLGEPLVIGDAVIYITAKGDNTFHVAIDAPREIEILRDDVVYKLLNGRRFYWLRSDVWERDGEEYSTREAINIVRGKT